MISAYPKTMKPHAVSKASVFIMILIVSSSLAMVKNVNAEGSFHGVITQSATWTKANNPYTLDGPTSIASGVTITVEPGVTVNLNGYYLQVNGSLIVRGTANEKIYFTNGRIIYTSASPGGTVFEYTVTDELHTATTLTITKNTFNKLAAGGSSTVTDNLIANLGAEDSATITKNQITKSCDASGSAKITQNNIQTRVVFRGGSTTIISNNQISDGVHCDSGGGTVIITDNQITNTNKYPIIFITAAEATVSNNKIIGQNTPDSGIRVMGSYHSSKQSRVTITGNQISGCKTGVEFSGGWGTIKQNVIINNNLGMSISVSSSFSIPASGTNVGTVEQNTIAKNGVGLQYSPEQLAVTIQNNNLQDNSNYNFKITGTGDVSIPNNYWGSTSTDEIKQKIYDYNYDFNLGKVNYTPILNQPAAGAPAVPSDVPTIAPTQTPTNQPTINPATPTNAPSQPANPTPFELNIVEVAILVVLVIIAVLLAVLIVTIRSKKK
ncbi:hypothetical protein GX563_02960 [Candidatus Bathyarchaeota archaeon]|nr:hypothetical protein [Candidatus Bathyarchaeota archaeon]